MNAGAYPRGASLGYVLALVVNDTTTILIKTLLIKALLITLINVTLLICFLFTVIRKVIYK